MKGLHRDVAEFRMKHRDDSLHTALDQARHHDNDFHNAVALKVERMSPAVEPGALVRLEPLTSTNDGIGFVWAVSVFVVEQVSVATLNVEFFAKDVLA